MIKGLDIKILNWYYSKCEHYGGKLSVWAWHKRWNNRKHGIGYKNEELSSTSKRR